MAGPPREKLLSHGFPVSCCFPRSGRVTDGNQTTQRRARKSSIFAEVQSSRASVLQKLSRKEELYRKAAFPGASASPKFSTAKHFRQRCVLPLFFFLNSSLRARFISAELFGKPFLRRTRYFFLARQRYGRRLTFKTVQIP